MNKTKILATYGPAIANSSSISRLVDAGVNAFRINCSHGNTEDFRSAARLIRIATARSQYAVGLLFDISGPKLRLARFDGQLSVRSGQRITLSSKSTDLQQSIVAVNHPVIIESIEPGERLYVDDGAIGFIAEKRTPTGVTLKAVNSGTLLPSKGVNLPDSVIRIPTIGPKDRRDIKTAVDEDADFIALSFVRSPNDIITARRLVKRCGGKQRIIAKLEKREAIEQLDEIVKTADGIMIARGDLGVELPAERLPAIQKRIIALANQHRKPVIVATQMLESMRFSPRPTRAEVNDVASAVFDFADCVMLSAETATGQYPIEAVRTMAAVINATEQSEPSPPQDLARTILADFEPMTVGRMVSRAASDRNIRVIFAFTTSGFTAELISNLFPPQPIIALTAHPDVVARLSLIRSVYPIMVKHPDSFEATISTVNRVSREYKLAKKGDQVIITGGAPFGRTVKTNFVMVHEVA